MSHKPKSHPKNVEGDFYVEDGCCTGCMVPEYYAPNLVAFDESDFHCFIARQPHDDSELYQAIKVTWASEVECIRYSGKDPQILRRLAEAGVADCCDQKHLIQDIEPLLRNHVTFENSGIKSELVLAEQFKEYVSSRSTEHLRYKVSKISHDKLGGHSHSVGSKTIITPFGLIGWKRKRLGIPFTLLITKRQEAEAYR